VKKKEGFQGETTRSEVPREVGPRRAGGGRRGQEPRSGHIGDRKIYNGEGGIKVGKGEGGKYELECHLILKPRSLREGKLG